MHLNRSATRPCSEKEREDNGLPRVIAQSNRFGKYTVASGRGQFEVRRDSADFQRLSLRSVLCQYGRGEDGCCKDQRERSHGTVGSVGGTPIIRRLAVRSIDEVAGDYPRRQPAPLFRKKAASSAYGPVAASRAAISSRDKDRNSLAIAMFSSSWVTVSQPTMTVLTGSVST